MPEVRQFPGFGQLSTHPPVERWEDWTELDPKAWPRRVERHYTLVPTVCFNCEAACGLLAYVNKQTGKIDKLEGLPTHPASRGRNCPKGPATVAQVSNPDRILQPLKRRGTRGGGQWEPVTWDHALEDIAGRIRTALLQDRKDKVVYHVGRHGEDGFAERVLMAWGVDGHNSHTNVCSAGARMGYTLWMGYDRPLPDHAEARFILLLSSHLESGHYFNPHAQRIVEAKLKGAKVAVIDTRLSNTASQADWWVAPWPGTEAGLLLAVARELMERGACNHEFLFRWTNWEEFMADQRYLQSLVDAHFLPHLPHGQGFDSFLWCLRHMYADYTPEWAAKECGIDPAIIGEIATEIERAGTAWSSHIWRNAAQSHRGGWMVTRALFFLHVLTGSVGVPGGCLPAGYAKFIPKPMSMPEHPAVWNEAHFPREFPLSHFELSFLLPHLMERQNHRIDVYFTRVYNPVWTNPDGATWIEMLTESDRIGCHVALTPVWSETAQYADYVLPMGLAPERHDLHSFETHAAQWLGFRQPVLRVAAERQGKAPESTREVNPGEVWEEVEFWIELSWRIDPDGTLGIRKYFESPYRPGAKVTTDEYYGWIFEHSVPGLPDTADGEGLTPLQYMKKYAACEVTRDVYAEYERPVSAEITAGSVQANGALWADKQPPRINLRPTPGPFKDGQGRFRTGVMVDGEAKVGFPTPSGKLEFFSTTLRDWRWPEYAVPLYPRDRAERERMVHITSQVHHEAIDWQNREFILLPTFRLPTLIHTRTNGAKWLYEISHVNPIWINPVDAAGLGVQTGDMLKVKTEIGYFVDRVWVTESIRPGVIACSHHLGRWRLFEETGSDRWNSSVVKLRKEGTVWRMQQVHGPQPFDSADPDSKRIWWDEGGVHQNLAFPVQPDPISGAHCWHQRVSVSKPEAGEQYAEVAVDTGKSRAALDRWLKLCRPAPGPDGTRRPYWMLRPLKPQPTAYRFPGTKKE
ncbi:MAG TPA: molybdopterin-dependent oxidoreductase [Symbiobacteriaceae bacterium]|nr:molybdopterin-dependent oxidoreductase [Symbiobacteriaceae bacterium]